MQHWQRLNGSILRSARNFLRLAVEEGLHRFILVIFVILFAAAALVFAFEYRENPEQYASLWDGVWWAIVTACTVGYGDKYPLTVGGRIVAMAEMLVFMILVGPLLGATVTTAFVSKRIKEAKGLEEITLTDHLIVCGWNPHIDNVLENLRKAKTSSQLQVVLIADIEEELANEHFYSFPDLNMKFVRGDFCSESVLTRANAAKASYALILADYSAEGASQSDQRVLRATLALKRQNRKMRISAELHSEENMSSLRAANAEEIVLIGKHSGYLLTAGALFPGMPSLVRELLSPEFGHALWQKKIPREFVGRPFSELAKHLMETRGDILIGVIGRERGMALEDVLGADPTSIDAFIKQQFEAAGKKELTYGVENLDVKVNPGPDYTIKELDAAIVIEASAGRQ
ncbi:MAG: NAD-binding protein [bacterium]|jgi:voltage-gated potassium channel